MGEGRQAGCHNLLRVVAPPVTLCRHCDPGIGFRLDCNEQHGGVFQQPVLVKVHGASGGIGIDLFCIIISILPGQMLDFSILRDAVGVILHIHHLPERHIGVVIPAVICVVQNDGVFVPQKPVFVLPLSVEGPDLRKRPTADRGRDPV